MKKTNTAMAAVLAALTFSAVSCATSGSLSSEAGNSSGSMSGTSIGKGSTNYATFLGEFDPQRLPETMVLYNSFGKLKPRNLEKTYLIPRTNMVEIHFRDNINDICIILPEASRHAIISAADQFYKDVEAESIRDEKPTDKNAYASMKCDFWWGVASPVYGAENTKMLANTKIVEGKAYFVLRVPSAEGTDKQNRAFSPYTELYFTPAQLHDFCDIIEQEYLVDLVSTLQEKADRYYY